MRVPRRLFVLSVAAALAPSSGSPQDPPHWSSTTVTIDCTSQCHTLHQAAGSGLTQSASNVNLCQSCHNSDSAALAKSVPLGNADKAVPGLSGTSHAFDVAALHPGFDTQAPADTERSMRLMGGQVVCSTCHDQHKSEQPFSGASDVLPTRQTTTNGSTGSVVSGGSFTGPEGVWYLIEIVASGNETNAGFRYSKDNGSSFFPTAPATLTAGVGVALDAGVTVSFAAGSYQVGERWEFAAAWPFLRWDAAPATTDPLIDTGPNGGSDDFCRDCHRSWVMTHTDVHTWDGSYKSHPVGVSLDANGAGYDRTAPLDGNGAAQGSAGMDGNPTNDLRLDATGRVQCLTCHGVHYADSNTQTVDVP